MVNKSDIAKLTNVSISTVSKAFSNSTDISQSTKEKILKCALEMGYEIGNKVKKNNGKIAIVVEGLYEIDSNKFEYQIVFGFKLEAVRAGYEVEIIKKDLYDKDWSFKKQIEHKDYSGVFLLRMFYSEELLKEIKNTNIPTIIFDNSVHNSKTACIGCDNEDAMSYLVEHLVGLGHKTIGFYGGTPMVPVSVSRKQGFLSAMKDCGIKVNAENVYESDFGVNHASQIIPKMIKNKVTAIVCASDMLAKYAIDELSKYNLKVPQDISVTGFDNVPLSEELNLTTVSQSSVELGRSSFYLLKRLFKGISVSKLLFRPSLIIRKSTKKIID